MRSVLKVARAADRRRAPRSPCQQELGQVRAVLPGDAGDEGALHVPLVAEELRPDVAAVDWNAWAARIRHELERFAWAARATRTVRLACRDGARWMTPSYRLGASWAKGIAYLARHLINAQKAVRLVGVDLGTPDSPGAEAARDGDDHPWIREHGGPYSAFGGRHAPPCARGSRVHSDLAHTSAEAAGIPGPTSGSACGDWRARIAEIVRDNIIAVATGLEAGGLLLGRLFAAASGRDEGSLGGLRSQRLLGPRLELGRGAPGRTTACTRSTAAPSPADPTIDRGARRGPAGGKDHTPKCRSAMDSRSPKHAAPGVAAGRALVLTPGNFQLQGAIVASGGGVVLTTGGARGSATVLRAPDTSTSREPSDQRAAPQEPHDLAPHPGMVGRHHPLLRNAGRANPQRRRFVEVGVLLGRSFACMGQLRPDLQVWPSTCGRTGTGQTPGHRPRSRGALARVPHPRCATTHLKSSRGPTSFARAARTCRSASSRTPCSSTPDTTTAGRPPTTSHTICPS